MWSPTHIVRPSPASPCPLPPARPLPPILICQPLPLPLPTTPVPCPLSLPLLLLPPLLPPPRITSHRVRGPCCASSGGGLGDGDLDAQGGSGPAVWRARHHDVPPPGDLHAEGLPGDDARGDGDLHRPRCLRRRWCGCGRGMLRSRGGDVDAHGGARAAVQGARDHHLLGAGDDLMCGGELCACLGEKCVGGGGEGW